MDRSFLSDPDVVAASREFVCVRLATYEDAEEAELLSSLFVGRSGELENTVFTILSPDGRRKLVRAGRSPHQIFGRAGNMAAEMREISARYRSRDMTAERLGLPALHDVRLGLNVAACDRQKLVVISGANDAERARLQQRVAELAWTDELQGSFLYAIAEHPSELAAIGARSPGVFVVEPDAYGESGKVIAHAAADADDAELRDVLVDAAGAGSLGSVDSRRHIREGMAKGVHWETVVPVTDPGGKRGRGRPR